jgi:tetratricopeptide (TPR) repeat protein
MSALRTLSTLLLAAIIGTAALAQTPAATDPPADVKGGQSEQAVQADALYKAQNFIAALPLYEDLHKRHPRENQWRERLAMCLLAAGDTETERHDNRERARSLLIEARDSGDNSALLQVLLEKLAAIPADPKSHATTAPAQPDSPAVVALKQGDKVFVNGDLPGAMRLYKQAMALDPKLYEAPLFAGDAQYKMGNFDEAGRWFAQAIAINPNRETAYRYWGDDLMKAGKPQEAEAKFIDAIVAEPYQKTPVLGLKQWADATKNHLSSPAIKLPPRQEVGPTGGQVHIDANAANGPMGPAVTTYVLGATVYRFGAFAKAYPTETTYRHSLAEEAQSIRLALSTLKKNNVPTDQYDPTWKALADLDANNMLEAWILIDRADQGIAHDYVAYREAHRDLLHAYIAKYEVHPN